MKNPNLTVETLRTEIGKLQAKLGLPDTTNKLYGTSKVALHIILDNLKRQLVA